MVEPGGGLPVSTQATDDSLTTPQQETATEQPRQETNPGTPRQETNPGSPGEREWMFTRDQAAQFTCKLSYYF